MKMKIFQVVSLNIERNDHEWIASLMRSICEVMSQRIYVYFPKRSKIYDPEIPGRIIAILANIPAKKILSTSVLSELRCVLLVRRYPMMTPTTIPPIVLACRGFWCCFRMNTIEASTRPKKTAKTSTGYWTNKKSINLAILMIARRIPENSFTKKVPWI